MVVRVHQGQLIESKKLKPPGDGPPGGFELLVFPVITE